MAGEALADLIFLVFQILFSAGALYGLVTVSGFAHHDFLPGFLGSLLFIPILHSYTVAFASWSSVFADSIIGYAFALGLLYFGALAVFATVVIKVIYHESWSYSLQVGLPWLAISYGISLIPVFLVPELTQAAGKAIFFG